MAPHSPSLPGLLRRLARPVGLALLLGWPAGAGADPPPAPAASPEALTRAKEEFRKGVGFFEAGDLERALLFFRRSHEIFPSKQNTTNAALVLDRLGRHDEAIELYEEVIGKFQGELSEAERAEVPQILAGLRAKVGELRINASVEGAVVIDGVPRGRTAPTPLLVLAGRHRVRVLKDGYEPFEAQVSVEAGGRASVEATLAPLRAVGRLRVEAAGAAEVLLDGLAVGPAPWEGSVAPGPHVVELRGEQQGSAPTRALIVEGQITLLRPRMGKLGPRLRIAVAPETAALLLDGVPLGRGRWEGRLPEGSFALEASEDGYFSASQRLVVGPAGSTDAQLSLRVNGAHPRWPRRSSWAPWAQVFGGYGAGPSLRSGAEAACPGRCPAQGLAGGPAVGARGGLEFGGLVSVELSAGYLALGQTLTRTARRTFPAASLGPVDYRLDEEQTLRGPWLTGGASLRAPAWGSWWLRGRVGVGVGLLSSRSRVRGTASAGGGEAPLLIPGAEDTQTSTPLLLTTELGVESRRGPWRFGASLGLLVVAQQGPDHDRGLALVPPSCSAAAPGAVGCAPAVQLLRGERAHGPAAFALPTLSVSREFGDR